jgi:23S rRNA pseudouridine2605 synthase
MRLAKYLAHAGVASRRAAEQLVFGGRVSVGGAVVRDPARDVGEGDDVRVDGRPVSVRPDHVVLALNKPAGVVSTARDTHGRPTVVGLVGGDRRLYPVGRLDADSTGLILLTDDGDLAHRLTHPSFEVPRVYRATVRRGPVREPALRRLREGVELEDGRTAPAGVRRVAADLIELTIREGRKHQVRRMCEAVGHPVAALERIAFGPLRLGALAPGAHRRLTPAEVERLRAASSARWKPPASSPSGAPSPSPATSRRRSSTPRRS